MNRKIKWINENPGASRDEAGYWQSVEGRFSIAPRYRHTIYPDSYEVRDNMKISEQSFDTVREAKAWAQGRVEDEHAMIGT